MLSRVAMGKIKTGLLGAALLVAAGALLLMLTRPAPSPSKQNVPSLSPKAPTALANDSPSATPAATIVITEAGFEPASLTIKVGQAVKFTNRGTVKHWPASNLHPSHLLYPEFDPKIGFAPGQSWTFVFTKPGSWRMHDHLAAYNKGIIVVER